MECAFYHSNREDLDSPSSPCLAIPAVAHHKLRERRSPVGAILAVGPAEWDDRGALDVVGDAEDLVDTRLATAVQGREHRAKSEGARRQMAREGLFPAAKMSGTINCDGVNAKGEICGVTTTSGLFFKIPGRVGDSPILGAGLYVDGEVGAAGSTGRGEANLFNLSSFLIVEGMRRGLHPKDAGMEALKRIRANTVEKRLLNARGNPNFNVNFYVLSAKGEFAGVAMYAEEDDERGWAGETGRRVRYAVCDAKGPRTLQVEGLLPGSPSGV